LKPEGRKRARSLAAVGIAIALTLILVTVTVTLPPPGEGASPLNYKVVTFGSWNDRSPAWSPDGKTIAYVSDQNRVWQVFTMNPDGASNRAITPSSYNATSPSWSPDSSSIAFLSHAGSQENVRVAFLVNSTVRTIAAAGTSAVQRNPEWSPDGRNLLFFVASSATTLVSYDFATMVSTPVATVAGGNLSACWVSQTEVVYDSLVNGSYQLLWADVRNGTQGVFLAGDSNSTAPVFSAASPNLAYISNLVPPNPYGQYYAGQYEDGDYNIWVMNLDSSDTSFQYGMVPESGETASGIVFGDLYPCPFTPGTISPVQDLALSPDGKVIAYVAVDQNFTSQVYLWEAFEAAASGPLANAFTNSTDPAWAPNGFTLAFASAQGGYYHIVVMNTTNMIQPLGPFSRYG
jgi:Tol biopolymer transport system component